MSRDNAWYYRNLQDGPVQWYLCALPMLRAPYQCLLEHRGTKQDCNMNNMRSEHCPSFIQERIANLNSYTGLLFHYTGQSWDRPPRTPPLSEAHKPWGTSTHKTHTHIHTQSTTSAGLCSAVQVKYNLMKKRLPPILKNNHNVTDKADRKKN